MAEGEGGAGTAAPALGLVGVREIGAEREGATGGCPRVGGGP